MKPEEMDEIAPSTARMMVFLSAEGSGQTCGRKSRPPDLLQCLKIQGFSRNRTKGHVRRWSAQESFHHFITPLIVDAKTDQGANNGKRG